MSERRRTTMRLFGVDITVDHEIIDDHSPTHQGKITIDETSRKRKTRSANQEDKEESEDSLPQKPKILRLFGVDIPIDHLLTTSSQDQEAITENPNQEEEEVGAPIPPRFDYPRMLERNPVLLFEKELTSSDVARCHNRLLITGSQRLMAALTEEERGNVEMNGGNFLRVLTIDEDGVEYRLRLKKWAGSGAIVLKHEWGKLVRANGLQKGDTVEGWGYRLHGEFRLALYIIRNQFN